MHISIIQEAIKLLLQEKKISYLQLANYLEVSEPTIKRTLNGIDFPVNRLMQICDFLQISLTELEERIKKNHQTQDDDYFTEAQENFLAEHLSYYYYFLKLHDFSPRDIAEKYHLSTKSQKIYLQALEKMHLIERTAKGLVRLKKKNAKVRRGGKLANAFIYQHMLAFNRFIEPRMLESQGKICNDEVAKYYIKATLSEIIISKVYWDNWWEEHVKMIHKLTEHSSIDQKIYGREKLIKINFAAHATQLNDEDQITFANLLNEVPTELL